MSFFTTILQKLGLAKEEQPAATPAQTPAPAAKPAAPAAKPTVASVATPKPAGTASMGIREENDLSRHTPAAPKAISEVDVVKKLEQMAKGSGLDWKVSIVDMLKILGIDSSKDARIELAKELGCPADLIGGDYSKMNVWLHKEVLRRIAQNGGNIPANMLD